MLDLVGEKYERLLVVEFIERKNKHSYWKCECDCGNFVEKVTGNDLRRGHTKSCGCLRKEITRERSLKHGDSVNRKHHRLYGIWSNMKQRCTNDNLSYFQHYGGRGITCNPKWEEYLGFKEDMNSLYKRLLKLYGNKVHLSLERKDVNGNYCKENCTFIPLKQQPLNTTRANLKIVQINLDHL